MSLFFKSFFLILFCFPVYSGEQAEFQKREAELMKVKNSYYGKQAKIKGYVKQRSAEKDAKKRKVIREKLHAAHRDMQDLYSKYLKLYNEIKYRYPKYGKKLFKQNIKVPSLKEIESQLGFHDLLDRTKKKIDEKYQVIVEETELEDDRDFEIRKAKIKRKTLKLVK